MAKAPLHLTETDIRWLVVATTFMIFAALMGVGPHIAKDTINDVYLDPFPSYEDN
jgi:hypothetical protein